MLSLGRSNKAYYKYLYPYFKHLKITGSNTLYKRLLELNNFKECSKCKVILDSLEFSSSTRNLCRCCKAEYNKSYYEANKDAVKESSRRNAKGGSRVSLNTVAWSNLEEIKEFYQNCPSGWHVDHIIPLKGKNVCGLHVLNNLQYLTQKQNLQKGNSFDESYLTVEPTIDSTKLKAIPISNKTNYCSVCDTQISLKNKSGFCKEHKPLDHPNITAEEIAFGFKIFLGKSL